MQLLMIFSLILGSGPGWKSLYGEEFSKEDEQELKTYSNIYRSLLFLSLLLTVTGIVLLAIFAVKNI